MKKTKRSLNTWGFLAIYLAILAVFAGVYALVKVMDQANAPIVAGTYTPVSIPALILALAAKSKPR